MNYTSPHTRAQPSHYFGNVAPGWQGPGVIVPQAIYSEGPGLEGEGVVVPFGRGIALTQALQLGPGQGYDARPPTTRLERARLTLRLLWPGYAGWQANINVRERTATADPIPLHKLLKRIAECIQNFYRERQHAAFDPVAGEGWKLDGISFERLRLLELRQVSPGSWQPVLALR